MQVLKQGSACVCSAGADVVQCRCVCSAVQCSAGVCAVQCSAEVVQCRCGSGAVQCKWDIWDIWDIHMGLCVISVKKLVNGGIRFYNRIGKWIVWDI